MGKKKKKKEQFELFTKKKGEPRRESAQLNSFTWSETRTLKLNIKFSPTCNLRWQLHVAAGEITIYVDKV